MGFKVGLSFCGSNLYSLIKKQMKDHLHSSGGKCLSLATCSLINQYAQNLFTVLFTIGIKIPVILNCLTG